MRLHRQQDPGTGPEWLTDTGIDAFDGRNVTESLATEALSECQKVEVCVNPMLLQGLNSYDRPQGVQLAPQVDEVV